jgi:hypothetical protein
VQQLENIFASMMDQLTNMKVELNDVRVQNQYLNQKVNWTIQDIIIENIEKIEVKMQEIHTKLCTAKEQPKENAKRYTCRGSGTKQRSVKS